MSYNKRIEELKPCPFCGHDAVIEVFKVRKGYEATVQCTGCLANMPTITFDYEEEAEKEAIKAWNSRQSKQNTSRLGGKINGKI